MAKVSRSVIGGVDTHADQHTAAVLDTAGRLLGVRQFGSDAAGLRALVAWLRRHGQLDAVGVEGTGSYGASLNRLLTERGVRVVEVDRADRRARRARGKSDPVDAEAAARAVLAGTATGTPKTRSGVVESLRVLRAARSGAVKARTAALNALVSSARSAPEPLASSLRSRTARQLVSTAAAYRLPGADNTATKSERLSARAALLTDPVLATKTALRRQARRVLALDEEIRDADHDLQALIGAHAPRLLERNGVGTEVAAQLLTTAGDNPQRLADDRAFAALTGVAPLPASSGRTTRHRLNRGGDRAANSALHTVVLSRMACDPTTRAYVDKRTKEGLSKREIMRCLKRYVARELFPLLIDALAPQPTPAPATLAA